MQIDKEKAKNYAKKFLNFSSKIVHQIPSARDGKIMLTVKLASIANTIYDEFIKPSKPRIEDDIDLDNFRL